jgi:hypothetical protein
MDGEYMEYVRRIWSRSKVYRVVLTVAILYTLLRLAVHGVLLAGMLLPDPTGEEEYIPIDLQLYLDAAQGLHLREDLYPPAERIEVYQYSPTYALVFTPALWLSPAALLVTNTLLHIAAYVLMYIWWGRIFRRLGLARASEMLALTLPVWLVFSAFWSDLSFLNVYILVACLATLLIDAVLSENLGWSLVWLSVIVQIKPHWAFAAAVPLLLGRYRFFFRLVGFAALIYVAVVGVTMLAVGPAYGWRQQIEFYRFLWNMRQAFPWRGPEAGFLGYNHSVTQITTYLLGVSAGALRLATLLKSLLLVPLLVVVVRHLWSPARLPGYRALQLGLNFAFVLYMAVFIWMDMVWEVSLGIALFTHLLGTAQGRGCQVVVSVAFLPYALLDLWRILSFVMIGPDGILPGGYLVADPSIYIPLVMIVILTFY